MILCFDPRRQEVDPDPTEQFNVRIANVERDDPNFVTVYYEPDKYGRTWYITLSNEELNKIKAVD